MDLNYILLHYGALTAVVVYILIKDVIPFLINKYFPDQMKRANDERATRYQVANEERLARIRELADERAWHRQMEQGHLDAMNKLSEAVNAVNLSITQQNFGMSEIRASELEILRNQRDLAERINIHDDNMMGAISEMREEVARRRGIEEGKKLPRTGPLTDTKGESKP